MTETLDAQGLSSERLSLLRIVLDELIPADGEGRLPAAGELGLADAIASAVAASSDLKALLETGLDLIESRSRDRDASGFAALGGHERSAVLTAVSSEATEFFDALLLHAYGGYYQNPRVLEALGLEPRPPFPDGYEMSPPDLGLLEGVRGKPRMYREV